MYKNLIRLLKSRYQTFEYNFGWSDYVWLIDGWVARCAVAVPILGYLILFNDFVTKHISFNILADENFRSFGLENALRLQLIYFGLIFLGLSNVIYRFKRPYLMKFGKNEMEYANTALSFFTYAEFLHIHQRIRDRGHRSLYGKYYDNDWDGFSNLAIGESPGRGPTNNADWAVAKSRYESLLRSILLDEFYENIVKRRVWLCICIALSMFGFCLLMIPSIDLFIKVILVAF